MTSKKRIIAGGLFLFVMAGGLFLLKLYRQPLGPTLDLPTSTQPNPTLTTFPVQQVAAEITATDVQATATSTPEPLCGGPAVMNILAVGSDSRGQNYLYGLADVIRLVRVDFVNARVTILEVPRDLLPGKVVQLFDQFARTGVPDAAIRNASATWDNGCV